MRSTISTRVSMLLRLRRLGTEPTAKLLGHPYRLFATSAPGGRLHRFHRYSGVSGTSPGSPDPVALRWPRRTDHTPDYQTPAPFRQRSSVLPPRSSGGSQSTD